MEGGGVQPEQLSPHLCLSCSNSRAEESSTFGPFHFHFNSVAALRVLLVWAKARWLVDMVSGVGGILPENSVKNVFCDMPMCISTEQAWTKWMLSLGYPAFYL